MKPVIQTTPGLLPIDDLDKAIVGLSARINAIKSLPTVAASFSSGELSYSKVRAMTRVVGPHSEEDFVTFALQTTTARVEERCRELRCGRADSTESANRAFANRSLKRVMIRLRAHSGAFRRLDLAVWSYQNFTDRQQRRARQ